MRAMWAGVLLVLGAGVARADVVFDFTIDGSYGETGKPYATVGKFYATDLGPRPANWGTLEAYLVTGASGETGGVAITGVAPLNTDGLANDNMLYVATGYGNLPPFVVGTYERTVGFTLADGVALAVLTGRVYDGIVSSPPGAFPDDIVNYRISLPEDVAAATPEPGTMGLVGTGVLGVVGMVRRRMRG